MVSTGDNAISKVGQTQNKIYERKEKKMSMEEFLSSEG